MWYTSGKPDSAGGPLEGFIQTRKPVYAGGLIMCTEEARQSGRPHDKKDTGKPAHAGGYVVYNWEAAGGRADGQVSGQASVWASGRAGGRASGRADGRAGARANG